MTDDQNLEELAAALVVTFLRANGVEAYAWQESAGRSFGLFVGSLGVSHIMVREDQEQIARSLRSNLVECGHCGVDLKISDQEVIQGWCICPACQNTNYPGDSVTCLSCGSQIYLDEAERERGWYRCPECVRLTQMTALDKVVECGHCERVLELSDQEAIQGWFICPACQGVGFLGGPVTCLSCGNKLDLDETEWRQGWYRCPECNQLTHLTGMSGEDADPAPEPPAHESEVNWVHLMEVTGAKEAFQVVSFLRANGIEAYTWHEAKAGRAIGSSAGELRPSGIMVQEEKVGLALSLLTTATEEVPESDEL